MPQRTACSLACLAMLCACAAARAQAAPAAEPTLPAVTVRAGAVEEKATAPVEGYLARRNSSATKTDTPLVETPQSVTVITAGQIRDTASTSIVGALAYAAGVIDNGGFNPAGEKYSLRGFASWGDMFRDGLYYGGAWGSRQEPWGVERVEVLKGAASVMYGKASPGGVINVISKRPTGERFGEVEAALGSHSTRHIAADLGGLLGEADSPWSYRLTMLARQGDTQVDHVPNDRLYFAPALTWRPSAATSLTLLGQLQRSDVTFINGLPALGSLLPNVNGRLPTNLFTGEPGWDTGKDSSDYLGYLFEHRFDDTLRLDHRLRYGVNKVHWRYSYITGIDADERTAHRSAYDRRDRTAMLTSDTFLEWKLGGAGMRHTLIAGLDASRIEDDTLAANWNVQMADLDLFAPVYGQPVVYGVPDADWRSKSVKAGLYLQDQVRIGTRWTLLAGVRHDRVHATDNSGGNERDRATTGRLGAVYQLDGGLAPFASFSQSFEPVSGYDPDGKRLEPTRGEQYELGLRWQPADADTLFSAALFQLKQTNVSSADPANPQHPRQIGEVRSRGLELEAKTRIARRVDLTAAYAYIDSVISRSLDPAVLGDARPGLPRHSASLWADAALDGWGLGGASVGLGLRHIGEQRNEEMSDARAKKSPAATLLDLRLGYETGPWRLALNVVNLADKVYWATCSYDACVAGMRRTLTGTVGYRW